METEQRTEEWFRMRAGAFTSSRAADLMAKLKSGKPAATRSNLITTLAVERLTGDCVETFQNEAMRRGIELEPEARDAYVIETGNAVDEIAFIAHPTIERCGCSPDGLIGDDGMLELKCPAAMAKHLDALQRGAHATEYRWQIQFQLFVSGREWCDAVSYDPRFPIGLQLATKRVEKNAEDHEQIAAEIATANAEIETIVNNLNTLQGAEAA